MRETHHVLRARSGVQIQFAQSHSLIRIDVQFSIAAESLGHRLVFIKSHRWQGLEQTRGETNTLFLWEAQC